MVRQLLCAVALIAVLMVVGASALNSYPNAQTNKKGTSIPVGRHPHTFTPNAKRGNDRKSIGNSVPMNGGLLNYGAFFINVSVSSGNSAQAFNMIVDTGSSNTAVPTVGCKTCGSSDPYNPAKSASAKKLDCGDPMCLNCHPAPIGMADKALAKGDFTVKSSECPYGPARCFQDACAFGITYGGGGTATAGNIGTEYACLGDKCATIYLDRILDQYPSATQPAGILGLAYPANACNPTCQPTILDSLVDQGLIAAQDDKFGMCLTARNGGVLDLGFSDEAKYSGELQYTPIVKQGWYNIGVEAMLVGDKTLDIPPFYFDVTNDVIGTFVDSGTSIVIVSPYSFSQFKQVVQNDYTSLSSYTGPLFSGECVAIPDATVAAFPKVSFMVKGMNATAPTFPVSMTGKDYLMETSEGSGVYCLGIAGVPSIGLIMGDVIMQNYYIEFDRYNNRLGFAPVKKCTV